MKPGVTAKWSRSLCVCFLHCVFFCPKVVQCRVKNQNSRKPFAFVLVEGVEDKDMATGSEIFVGLNQLTVSVSNRSRNHAAALSREEDLRVLPNLRSFSIGVALDQRGAFLERWSSAGMHDQVTQYGDSMLMRFLDAFRKDTSITPRRRAREGMSFQLIS